MNWKGVSGGWGGRHSSSLQPCIIFPQLSSKPISSVTVDIFLVHDSKVEKSFRKITFLQLAFYIVLSQNNVILKSVEFGKAFFK